MKKIFFSILFFALWSPINAQTTYELKDGRYAIFDKQWLNYLEFFKDSTNAFSLAEVTSQPFLPVSDIAKVNFDTSSNYWYRIKLSNKTSLYKLWIFEVTDPHIDKVQVYQINGKDTITFPLTGYEERFRTRLADHKNFLFPIRFYNSDSCYLYFSIKNSYTNLSYSLRPAEQFMDYAFNEYYFLGIFYGILLIMAMYNFFIFFSTKETVYLYYVAYVLCYCLNSFREDGIGFQYLWPNMPEINNWVNIWSSLLLIIAFVFYSKKFLVLHLKARKLNRWLNNSLIVFCGLYVLNQLFFQNSWISYLYLFPFGLVYASGIYVWKQGDRSAKYFLLAFSFLVLCFTVFVFRITGLISTNIFTVYALNFGFLVEVVLFSYALGQRLKYEKDQKEKMDELLIKQLRKNEKLKDSLNKKLEKKVEERTRELSVALQELQSKNKQIEELNGLLENDNKALNQDIKNITKARLMLKDLTLEEFKKIYPDEEACLKYLADIKWGKNYSCKKCGNETSSAGKTLYSRRCTKCGYDESATSFTLFHKSKLPITTSFYLVYLVLAHKNVSSHELSEKLGLRQKTCWAFKKKITEAMNNGKSARLNSREWGRIFYN